jgi:hypothetical protein
MWLLGTEFLGRYVSYSYEHDEKLSVCLAMSYATSSDGTRIHCEVEGDGPPLLLAHGFMATLRSWVFREGSIEKLLGGHDRARHGAAPRGYQPAELAGR